MIEAPDADEATDEPDELDEPNEPGESSCGSFDAWLDSFHCTGTVQSVWGKGGICEHATSPMSISICISTMVRLKAIGVCFK